ncbi:DIP1984 family protein [Psychrobacillus psychrodurans]|uniref:DIP1984 family protein n=1 Tax=Psychrobacillus psychrodurans TaxID=126157 RepID=A0A9X3L6E3_9BACI|nr:DIP1984 family protein [Psychrobacillus psychrodurans]MCZ8532181.1 DIP1984 family protein [Psychrobacillus psychrodurans]
MKLGEALIVRSDYQKRIEQLRNRLLQNVKIQEGESPNEDPYELKKELNQIFSDLKQLIKNINRTNLQTAFDDHQSLADALTERDLLGQERKVYSALLEAAAMQQDRYSRTEIKFVTTIKVKETQKYVDELSQKHRMLDTKIQEINWLTNVIE